MTVQHEPVAATTQVHVHAVPDRGSDAEIAEQFRKHHAAMVAELDRLTATLRDAVPAEQETAHKKVGEWFEAVLVPHAEEEEATTYRAAGELAEGRLLIEAMLREHILIKARGRTVRRERRAGRGGVRPSGLRGVHQPPGQGERRDPAAAGRCAADLAGRSHGRPRTATRSAQIRTFTPTTSDRYRTSGIAEASAQAPSRLRRALSIVPAADTLSIAVMEVVDNVDNVATPSSP